MDARVLTPRVAAAKKKASLGPAEYIKPANREPKMPPKDLVAL